MRKITLGFLLLSLYACDNSDQKVSITEAHPSAVAVPAATPTIDKATLYKWEDSLKRSFSGECHEGNGYYLKLFVYITDTGKVKKVTEILRRKYDGRFSEAFDIWYFDMLSSNTSFCSVPKNE